MIISIAETDNLGAPLIIAVVTSEFTRPESGPKMVRQIQKHIPTKPIMLVSVESRGFRAFGHFETHRILAMIQLENLALVALDLDAAPPEQELPF